MHALVVLVRLEPGHDEEGRAQLETDVLPRVRQAPGVVAGYWAQSPKGDRGYSMIVFESEEAAGAAADMAQNAPRPDFVTFDTVEVCEVVAQL